MSAARLREATKVLRGWCDDDATEVVEITNGTDTTTAYNVGGRYFLDRVNGCALELREGIKVTRGFHEQIRPELGLALADWLDDEASRAERMDAPTDYGSDRLADLILGGA